MVLLVQLQESERLLRGPKERRPGTRPSGAERHGDGDPSQEHDSDTERTTRLFGQ